jgi:hypothetical protein
MQEEKRLEIIQRVCRRELTIGIGVSDKTMVKNHESIHVV